MKKLNVSQIENLRGGVSPFGCMALGIGTVAAAGYGLFGVAGVHYAAAQGWYSKCWNS